MTMFYENKFHVSQKNNSKWKFTGLSKGNKKIQRRREKMKKKVPIAKSPQQTDILIETCCRNTCLDVELFERIKYKFWSVLFSVKVPFDYL